MILLRYVRYGAAASALAAADLLDCFDQSRIIFIGPPGGRKMFCAFGILDRRGPVQMNKFCSICHKGQQKWV